MLDLIDLYRTILEKADELRHIAKEYYEHLDYPFSSRPGQFPSEADIDHMLEILNELRPLVLEYRERNGR